MPACYDLSVTSCDPGSLAPGAQYSWRVIATDEHGATLAGPVWGFTTASEPGNPWTVVFSDDFEGSFPGPWDRSGGDYMWDKSNCRADTGTDSA